MRLLFSLFIYYCIEYFNVYQSIVPILLLTYVNPMISEYNYDCDLISYLCCFQSSLYTSLCILLCFRKYVIIHI